MIYLIVSCFQLQYLIDPLEKRRGQVIEVKVKAENRIGKKLSEEEIKKAAWDPKRKIN